MGGFVYFDPKSVIELERHGLTYQWQTNCPEKSAIPFLTGVLRGGLSCSGINTIYPGHKYYENSIIDSPVGEHARGYVGIYSLKI